MRESIHCSTSLIRSVIGQIHIGILRSFPSILRYTKGNCSWVQRVELLGGDFIDLEVEKGPEIRVVDDGINRQIVLKCVVDNAEQLNVIFTVYGKPAPINGQWLMPHYIIIRSR